VSIANIHASCLALGRAGQPFGAPEDAGVLILGASGMGKSDLALRLVERGAVLVADDRVDLFESDGRLWGSAPAGLAGLLEIRGAGIVSLPYRSEAAIALVIELVAPDAVPRLPEHGTYAPPEMLGLPESARPPLLRLAALESSAPAKIAAAAAAFAHALFRGDRPPP
jgi:serine kinase of HPr protein (carbohydrate metabolism regulator)